MYALYIPHRHDHRLQLVYILFCLSASAFSSRSHCKRGLTLRMRNAAASVAAATSCGNGSRGSCNWYGATLIEDPTHTLSHTYTSSHQGNSRSIRQILNQPYIVLFSWVLTAAPRSTPKTEFKLYKRLWDKVCLKVEGFQVLEDIYVYDICCILRNK